MKKYLLCVVVLLFLLGVGLRESWAPPVSYGPSSVVSTVDTSGTPASNDFARFTDVDTLEGRSYTETISDLSLDARYIAAIVNAADMKVSTTTSTHEWSIQVYDNDTGPAWVDALTFVNGNSPGITLGSGVTLSGIGSVSLASIDDYAVTGSGSLNDIDLGFTVAQRTPSRTPVDDTAANFAANFTGVNLYGGTFVCSTAGTIALPVVAAGANFTVITKGGIAVVIDPNAADWLETDGLRGSDGENITNLSTAGDIAVVQYHSSGGWLVSTNGWTPE